MFVDVPSGVLEIDHSGGPADTDSGINKLSSPPSASPLSSVPIKLSPLALCTTRRGGFRRKRRCGCGCTASTAVPFPSTKYGFLVTLRCARTPQLRSHIPQCRIQQVNPGSPRLVSLVCRTCQCTKGGRGFSKRQIKTRSRRQLVMRWYMVW